MIAEGDGPDVTRPMEKAFLDPVHGFILIEDDWLLRLIDTFEFQRLRRVRQLGASFGTYHGAEHTRFGHSLGALHIMRRILARLEHVHGPLTEETRIVAQAAALLHDVGHGPLSHCIEYLLTPEGHEHWTKQIILGDTEIQRVLHELDPSLPDRVASVISGHVDPIWVRDLVSSQLDVDRMDYLLRDALFTGADYGRFQLDRIVNTLTLHDRRIVVQQKGLQAIEEYVLARHFMYWRVYLHKTIRGMELLLRAAVRRARALAEGASSPRVAGLIVGGPLGPFFRKDNGLSASEYVDVDDADLFVSLKQWARSDDPVLADLSRRFLRRELLKPVLSMPVAYLPPELIEGAKDAVARAGFDPDYYCLIDDAGNVPYDTYAQADAHADAHTDVQAAHADARTAAHSQAQTDPQTDNSPLTSDGLQTGDPEQPIVVLQPSGAIAEISELSGLIRGLADLRMRALNIYVPAPCRPEVIEMVRSLERQFD